MFKRICCLVLAFCIVFSLCGCNKEKSKPAQSSKPSVVSKPKNNVTSDSKTSEVEEQVSDRLVFGTPLAKSDFGGQDFVLYFSHDDDYRIDREIDFFNKRNNARLKMHIIAGDFEENISKSIAAGTPFDLVENSSDNFPKTAFRDFYEPQQSYIHEYDYFSVAKPENGGFIKSINDFFTYGGNLYACGNGKTLHLNLVYYNKKMFRDKGIEEPYKLLEAGGWTWETFASMGKELNNASDNVSFLAAPSLSYWWNLCGVTPVSRNGDNFTANVGNKNLISVTENYRKLFSGKDAISVAENDINAFLQGKTYVAFSDTSMFYPYLEIIKRSDFFGRNSNNLGCVPIPSGLSVGGAYSAKKIVGFSTVKGAKVPQLAAAFSLSYSRIDSAVSGYYLDPNVRYYVKKAFATNGFLDVTALKDDEGLTYAQLFDPFADKILKGEDAESILKSTKQRLNKMISDTTALN